MNADQHRYPDAHPPKTSRSVQRVAPTMTLSDRTQSSRSIRKQRLFPPVSPEVHALSETPQSGHPGETRKNADSRPCAAAPDPPKRRPLPARRSIRVKLSDYNPRRTKRNLSAERGLYKLLNQTFMYTKPVFLAFILSLSAVAAVPNQYIVEVSGDPGAVHLVHHAPGKSIRSEEAKQRRAQIREDRKPVRAQLEAAQAQILDSVDTVANAFIVAIPDANAASLAAIPGVIHVYPV